MIEYLTFWTPNGWRTEPGNLADHLGLPKGDLDYYEAITGLGWEEIIAPDEAELEGMHIHRHASTGALLVETWGVTHRLASFFVDGQDSDVFFATEYLRMQADLVRMHGALLQGKLLKAQISFIRHGHGTDTIDEDGWSTPEDRKRSREASERFRRERAAVAHGGTSA